MANASIPPSLSLGDDLVSVLAIKVLYNFDRQQLLRGVAAARLIANDHLPRDGESRCILDIPVHLAYTQH
jgi:hypothetical protein